MRIIGIDLHGVLNKNPHIMAPLLAEICRSSIVTVISGPPAEEIKKELDLLGYKNGIHYNDIISVVDFIKSKGVEMQQDKRGHWRCDEPTWWSSKAEICDKYSVDILFDDSEKYKPHFVYGNTKFILMKGE